jgi:hypothetical protein
LCWLTVKQQFNPALAIASAVTANVKKKPEIIKKVHIIMKNSLRIFIFFICIFPLISTLENGLYAQTQGEQEKKWAKSTFRKQTDSKVYPIFSGEITIIDSTTFKFDEKTIILLNDARPEITVLLQNGIFYPNIITGDKKAVIKTQSELDTLTETETVIYNWSRTDMVKISHFEEIKTFFKSPKTRKFQFYLYRLGLMNATVCYVELTNKSATRKTSVLEFMKNSHVTFFKEGSILL